MKRFQGLLVGVAVMLGVGSAAAQSGKRVITLEPIPIVGRIQRPMAVVDVARIEPKMALTEIPRQFFLRIEHATYHEPY